MITLNLLKPKTTEITKFPFETKFCPKCKQSKLMTTEFFSINNKNKKYGLLGVCKVCDSEIKKEWRKLNPEKDAAYHAEWRQRNPQNVSMHSKEEAWRRYGITNADGSRFRCEDYKALKLKHNHRCGICFTDKPSSNDKKDWGVDHDHKTGFARGILCSSCNTHLGAYEKWYLHHEINIQKYLNTNNSCRMDGANHVN